MGVREGEGREMNRGGRRGGGTVTASNYQTLSEISICIKFAHSSLNSLATIPTLNSLPARDTIITSTRMAGFNRATHYSSLPAGFH